MAEHPPFVEHFGFANLNSSVASTSQFALIQVGISYKSSATY
jgi:hypothetical protein